MVLCQKLPVIKRVLSTQSRWDNKFTLTGILKLLKRFKGWPQAVSSLFIPGSCVISTSFMTSQLLDGCPLTNSCHSLLKYCTHSTSPCCQKQCHFISKGCQLNVQLVDYKIYQSNNYRSERNEIPLKWEKAYSG